MNSFQRFLIAVSEDPVKYAMRVLICLALALVVRNASAGPRATFEHKGALITLYDDDCGLTDSVFPLRATWSEGGKVIEGCWTVTHKHFVIAYFSDISMTVMRSGSFRPVVGI